MTQNVIPFTDVECVRADVFVAISIDSYNKALTVWEPLLEPWSLSVKATQGMPSKAQI